MRRSLRQYNAEHRANLERRRVEIARILTAYPDFTAKEVGKELERSGLNPLPERTLRLDLQIFVETGGNRWPRSSIVWILTSPTD
jgi:repressor of nif and glnA expression